MGREVALLLKRSFVGTPRVRTATMVDSDNESSGRKLERLAAFQPIAPISERPAPRSAIDNSVSVTNVNNFWIDVYQKREVQRFPREQQNPPSKLFQELIRRYIADPRPKIKEIISSKPFLKKV